MSKDDKSTIYESPDFYGAPSVKPGIKTQEEFRRLYECVFEPDQRYIELYNRLRDFYMRDDGSISQQWRDIKKWCRDHGYAQEEIDRAKKDVMSRKHSTT